MNQRYRIIRGTFGLINVEIQVVFFLWISAKSTCFYGNALKNVRNYHDAQEQGIRETDKCSRGGVVITRNALARDL